VSSRQTAWEKGSIYVHILQSCALLFTVLTTDMRTLSRATHIRTNIHANQMRSRTSFSHSTEPRADKSPKTEALLSDVPLSRHDLKGRMRVMNKQKNETKKGRCAATAGKTSYTLADAPSCRCAVLPRRLRTRCRIQARNPNLPNAATCASPSYR